MAACSTGTTLQLLHGMDLDEHLAALDLDPAPFRTTDNDTFEGFPRGCNAQGGTLTARVCVMLAARARRPSPAVSSATPSGRAP